MRRIILFFFVLPLFVTAQYSSSIQNYQLGAAELVVFPYGLEQRVVLGTVNSNGRFTINFPDLASMEVENKTLWNTDMLEGLRIECDQNSLVFSDSMAQLLTVENIFLYKDETIIGLLYAVSDPKLQDWLDELYYAPLVPGSFLNFLYLDKPTSMTGKCIIDHDEEEIQESIFYNLNLKAGWNFMLTELADIKKISEEYSIPSNQKITAVKQIPSSIIWIYRPLE